MRILIRDPESFSSGYGKEKFGSRINIPDSQDFKIEGNSAKLLMILLFYRMFTLRNELSEGGYIWQDRMARSRRMFSVSIPPPPIIGGHISTI